MEKDLVVLVADTDMEMSVRGLFSRPDDVGIRQVEFDAYRHVERDPGCRLRSQEFLRSMQRDYRHAIVMFDRHGCGADDLTREAIERNVEQLLAVSGWSGRSAALVLDPELEAWVWSDSPFVDRALGWHGRSPRLRDWLEGRGLLTPGQGKPASPKEAVLEALRQARRPRSPARYFELAKQVQFDRCEDPAFVKFRSVLQRWFPPPPLR